MAQPILQIALDTPLRQVFDYWPPPQTATVLPPKVTAESTEPLSPRAPQTAGAVPPPGTGSDSTEHRPQAAAATLLPGVRVRVPFGRQRLIGVLMNMVDRSTLPASKLRAAFEVLDTEPVFDAHTFALLRWAADYYHHPIGEVFAAAMPAAVRQGRPLSEPVVHWALTEAGRAELSAPTDRRAPKRRALLEWLDARGEAEEPQLREAGFGPEQWQALTERGFLARHESQAPVAVPRPSASPVTLAPEQAEALQAITAALGRFEAHLLFGVTGSGKTEVYLRAIEAVLARGGQTLVLVPEIGLTPQLLARFEERFGAGIAVLHSALTGSERHEAWCAARSGAARIVIGTRSAVFTPLPQLALIIVDEEHDTSFKQQEGFHYSARDLAVLRAQRAGVPALLGSATPSLESLENVAAGRYRQLRLPTRAGGAQATRTTLIDLRRHASEQGLSQPAIAAIETHLKAGGQVIVFLNRRGFAPTLFCCACGWSATCAHCDARMTLHRRAQRLRCHHCGAEQPIPVACGACRQPLTAVGQGTERVEETLQRLFPQAPLARLDRDAVSSRGTLHTVLDRVHRGEAKILVGTQMLTKGHHFPEVSLVVILDADQGLFATDYRATERLAQMITQVAGRAGRAARAGEVLIQTQYPEHPLLARLIESGYEGFAADALAERRAAQWPPYSRLALLRADARDPKTVDEFLRAAARVAAQPSSRPIDALAGEAVGRVAGHAADRVTAQIADQAGSNVAGEFASRPRVPQNVKLLGPATALMARRADRHRAHLLIEAPARPALQRFLSNWLPRVQALKTRRGLRWSIDVDPTEID